MYGTTDHVRPDCRLTHSLDGRKTVAGNKKANLFVYYEVDSAVVKHNLTMEEGLRRGKATP